MKIYEFFKIPDEEVSEYYDKDLETKYPLYAVTNDKKMAKRFQEDRNMKKFIFKVHKGLTREEYAEYCNKNRGAVLEIRKLTTIFDGNHTRRNAVEKDVLMTYFESQLVEEMNGILDDDGFWKDMPFPLIFKSKYTKMLDDLQYTSIFRLMNTNLAISSANKLYAMAEDYSAPSIMTDEVAKFIALVSDTL